LSYYSYVETWRVAHFAISAGKINRMNNNMVTRCSALETDS